MILKTKALFFASMLFLIQFAFITTDVFSHGIVGKRFFPATLAVHDPFPADEMAFAPAYTKDHHEKKLSLEFGIQKRLTPDIALSIESEYLSISEGGTTHGAGSHTQRGFANPEFTLTYAMFRNPEHEFIASAGLGFKLGKAGASEVGAEEHSEIVPAFAFGKGLGDLSDSLSYLRPVAFTGRVGLAAPLGGGHDETSAMQYGLVIEYSIPYLQSFVKDMGIPRPFNKMFPLIELTYGGHHGDEKAGFLNSGILWAGKYIELGIEANIPLNDSAGDDVGVSGLIQFFLDDIIAARRPSGT